MSNEYQISEAGQKRAETKDIYVCGPMSGLPQFNYPMFAKVTHEVRMLEAECQEVWGEKARTVVNPAEEDSPEMQAAALASATGAHSDLAKATTETWGDVLARDVKLIYDRIGSLVLLPNWFKSKGARLEVFVALLVGVEMFVEVQEGAHGLEFNLMTLDEIRTRIRENMP